MGVIDLEEIKLQIKLRGLDGEDMKVLIPFIRKMVVSSMAEDVLEATRMENEMREKLNPGSPTLAEAFQAMLANSRSEKWLIENGYEPLCPHTKLGWVKKVPTLEKLSSQQSPECSGCGHNEEF